MHTIFKKYFLATAVCISGLFAGPNAMAQNMSTAENIALGRSVIFDAKPNYRWTSDLEDDKQLTDGKYSSIGDLQNKEDTTSLWVQKGTVGWTSVSPAVITIDLGSVQPISGVSYSTAAGAAGVNWPATIYMAVSNDNQTWHPIGDLVQISRVNATPPQSSEGYQVFRYITHNLKTSGRYISFGVVQAPYTFVDEIEVYKGNEAWLNDAISEISYPSIKDYISKMSISSSAQRRLNNDITIIREAISKSSLAANLKRALNVRLDEDVKRTSMIEPLPRDFKTILPLNDIHRDILAVRGELLAKEGWKPITVWKQHRYAWLSFLAEPKTGDKVLVDFSMLRNQFRSDNVLVTNASGQPQNVDLQLKNGPRGASKGWLQIYSVEWTDTLKGIPVASALIPVNPVNGTYTVQIPAGMTRKIWLTVDSSKVPPGEYDSNLSLVTKSQRSAIPFALKVSSKSMGKPRLSLGGWDYSNSNNVGGIKSANKQAAIALMRSHYVDTPWGTLGVMPIPGIDEFDANGNLKKKLDISTLDNWISDWKGAKQYFVYLAVSESFGGFQMETAEFNIRVGNWVKAYSEHMRELGLKPQQLGVLLVDEPGTDAQDAIIAAWAKAINATAPELTLFSDPVWIRPDQAKIQDAITEVDILCPPLGSYAKGADAVRGYYQELRKKGKQLWFYGTSGPPRLMDPQQYYRYQAWWAFSAGATGQGYWSFGSVAGAPTSWNAYSETNISYSPFFIDEDTVYNSVHWDAVREGVEDYEELAMLADAIKASPDAVWRNQAQQVLDNALKTVLDTWHSKTDWAEDVDPTIVDTQMQKVRAKLADG